MRDELHPSQTAANPGGWVQSGLGDPAQGQGSHGMWGLAPPRWPQLRRLFPL